IIEPVGDDPLAQAATLRISAGAHTQTVPVTNGHYNVSFTLKTSNPTELEPVSVEALASDGTVVARGKTPLIQLAPSSGQLIVYVARPGSLGSPIASDGVSPTTITPRTRHAAAYYPGLGIFLAGGKDTTGQAQTSVALWFHYELTESTSSLWTLGSGRTDLV